MSDVRLIILFALHLLSQIGDLHNLILHLESDVCESDVLSLKKERSTQVSARLTTLAVSPKTPIFYLNFYVIERSWAGSYQEYYFLYYRHYGCKGKL